MKMAVSNQQIKKYCQKGKYKDEVKVAEDIQRVLSRYSHLKLYTDKYVYDDGSSKILLNLFGTVPVCYQGNNYNIPVRVWLQRTHPEDAPICFVEPTSDMYVEPSQYVDAMGKIYLPYLNQWQTPTFDTAGLLSVIITAFSERMPVYARNASIGQQNMNNQAMRRGSSLSLSSTSSDSSDYGFSESQPFLAHAESFKSFLHKAVKNYKKQDVVKRDVLEALGDHRHLKPQLEDWEDTDGKMKKTLNLSGTVTITFQGGSYNIPVCIWILRDYPERRPLCYVRPTKEMAIKASALVDPAGKIDLPYLKYWKYPNNDLQGLLQVIVVEFGKDCPIYSKLTEPNRADARRGSSTSLTSQNYMIPSSRPVQPFPQGPGVHSQIQESHYLLPQGQEPQYMSAAPQRGMYMPLGPTQPELYMPMNAVLPGQPRMQQNTPISYYNLGDGTDVPEHIAPSPQTPATRQMANRPLPPVPGQPAAQGSPSAARSQPPLPPPPIPRQDTGGADDSRKLQEELARARKEIELLTLREKTRELEEAQMCSICMEKKKDMAFQCGHMTCKACSNQLQTCPICRQAIERKISLYQC